VIPWRLYLSLAVVIFFLLQHFKPIKPGSLWFPNLQFNVTVVGLEAQRDRQMENMNALFPLVVFGAAIPMFALGLKLLYYKRKRLYAEHLVFAFHFFAFLILVLSPGILIGNRIVQYVGFAAVLVYTFLALREVYPERNLQRFVKFTLATAGLLTILFLCVLLSFGFAVLVTLAERA
jgi:hypothetical protein